MLNRRHLLAAALASPVLPAHAAFSADGAARVRAGALRSTLLDVALAGARLVAVGERGHVLLSDDQGKTWRQARAVPTRTTLTSLHAADPKNLWAAGHGGIILNSTDAGETWQVVTGKADGPDVLLAIRVEANGRGLAIGGFGIAMATADGGKTWKAAPLLDGEAGEKHLNRIVVTPAGTWLIAAEGGMVLRSDPTGASWAPVKTPYAGSLWSGLALKGGGIVIGGMRGNLVRSSDDGLSWTHQPIAQAGSLTGAAVLADGRPVLVGVDGTLLVGDADGASFRLQRLEASCDADRGGGHRLDPGRCDDGRHAPARRGLLGRTTMAELVSHETQDVDDQAKALSGWEQDYEQLGCGRFRGSAWQLVMRDGVLLRETTNRQLREQVVPPAGHLVFAVPLSVEPGSVFAGRPLERESLMVLGGQQQHDVISAGELDLIGLSIDRALLEATLPPAKLEWLERKALERNVELPAETAAAIRHMLLAVCADVEGRLPALADPAAEQALLSSTMGHAVILAMAAEGSASTIPRRAETRLKVVKRAVEFMRANLEEDVDVPQICAAACASRRTLQYCFEEFMHTTPQAYLRALRLNEARRALKARAQQPITELATTLGFASASHFTRHYKLMFDELPSETLKLHCYGPRI